MISVLVVAVAAGGASVVPVAGVTPSGEPTASQAQPTASDGQASGAIGAPEQANLTVAIPYPDNEMYHDYFIAEEFGWLDEAGLTIEVILADDTNAAVVGGSADIGVVSAGAAMQAINEGLPLEIIAQHACRQEFAFAVQADVNDVQDLAGADIVLAGTPGDPAQIERTTVLKEAGWDVEAVGANPVYPGPGSETWVEFFRAGQVKLIPFFSDDRGALAEAGAKFPIVELRAWPNDLYVARTGWVEENPSTAAQFLRAVMRSLTYLTEPAVGQPPANKDKILEIYEENGFPRDEYLFDSAYAFGTESSCPNLYYAEEAWDTTIEMQGLDISVAFDEATNLDALFVAQESLGLDNSSPAEVPYPA